jgi:hypothetical protein
LLRCQLQYSLTVFKYGSVRASLAPCTASKLARQTPYLVARRINCYSFYIIKVVNSQITGVKTLYFHIVWYNM